MWDQKATRKFLEQRSITLTVHPSQREPHPEYGERKPWDVMLQYKGRTYHVDPWYWLPIPVPPTVTDVVYDLVKMIVEYPDETLEQYLSRYLNRKRTREQHIADWQAWQDHSRRILEFFHLTRDELLQEWKAIVDQVLA